MLNISCLCGQVRLTLMERPEYVHECNCTLCRKTGARWGYFHPSRVTVEGKTRGYVRQDKAEPGAEIRFCEACGATTHFILSPGAVAKFGDTLMGVNLRLVDETELTGIELRFPDGQARSGEGAFGYVREPRVLGEAARSG